MNWETDIAPLIQKTAPEITPFFYVESGSRLWGMASQNSDYDIRGFHLSPKDWYFDYKPYPDTLEIIDGDLDIVSFDLDKFFKLLSKSNPNCMEWLRAHIIYYEGLPERDAIYNTVFKNYSPKTLFHHYISISHKKLQRLKNGKDVSYKAALYYIRALFSAQAIVQGLMPPLPIDELFDCVELDSIIKTVAIKCLNAKKQVAEKYPIQDLSIIEALEKYYTTIATQTVLNEGNVELLKSELSQLSIDIKNHYYC